MRSLAALIGCMVLMGCSAADLPSRLPSESEAIRATTGAWLVVYEGHTPQDLRRWYGELLAVENETISFFWGDSIKSLPVDSIQVAKLFVTDPPIGPGGATAWFIGGMLLTPTHGAYLVFSLPLWMLLGGISAQAVADDANMGDLHYPEDRLSELSKFARFPQGFPPGLDRSRLRPRVRYTYE